MSAKSVVCKFWVNFKKTLPQGNGTNEPIVQIKLGAIWEGSIEAQEKSENAVFGKATPWGSIEMGIANLPAADFFKPGKTYYVTFVEAEDEEKEIPR